MNCSNYVHNDPIGGSKFISGTTCTGTVAFYTLTLGQQVCMNNSRPLINLNGLVISGDCTGVTPTPTPTPIDFCYISGFSYYDAVFQCPNDGLDYYDRYGVWYFSAYTGSQFTDNHPQLNFTLTNGTDFATVSIEPGQYFTEFVYPKIDFRYTDTGCVSTTYPDWYIYTPPTTQCRLTPTPTRTPTPTVTPTTTVTPTVTKTATPTQTSTPTITPTISLTPTNSQTPTPTITLTPSITPTITPTITSTVTPTRTPTITSTVTPTITPTITSTVTPTRTPNQVFEYWTTLSGFSNLLDACASGQTCERVLYSRDNPLTSSPVRSILYTDAGLTTPYNGGALRYALSLNCGGTWRAAQITTDGQVFSTLACSSPTPTPTNVTSTPTPTITTTTTLTPTPTITPTISLTPTNTITPTPTITKTVTPTRTSSPTPTPSSTPPPFSPISISNLQYWFDASSGSSVSSWTNYGSLGGNISQGDSTLQPEVKTDSFMGAWTGTTMRFLNRDRMTGTFANVNFSAATQFLVYKQVSRATFGDIIGYRIWDGSSNIFSQWLSRTSTPVGAGFYYPFSGYTMSGNTLVGSPTLISAKTSGVTQGTAFIDMEINDTTQVMNTTGSTAYLSGNTFVVGGVTTFGGTNDVEFAELIVYNKVLNPTEFLQVENYLKNKYQYNTWTIPTPTPTLTPSITPSSVTPTPTPTQTVTRTPTQTPTITPTITKTPTLTPTKTPAPTPTRVNFYEYEVEYWERSGGSCNYFNTQTVKTVSPLNTNQYYCISFGGAGRYKINLLNGFGPSAAPLFTPVGGGNVNCTVLLNC